MVIPIHHTETVPMMNCCEGKVFTKYGADARTCMTKEEYDIQQDIVHHHFLSALLWSTVVVLLGVGIIYLINRD